MGLLAEELPPLSTNQGITLSSRIAKMKSIGMMKKERATSTRSMRHAMVFATHFLPGQSRPPPESPPIPAFIRRAAYDFAQSQRRDAIGTVIIDPEEKSANSRRN
ncbi:MAG: hypothetical protein R3F11_17680 [Verrucomicrobiales bacterium]